MLDHQGRLFELEVGGRADASWRPHREAIGRLGDSRILEVGAPCEAEIVRTQPLGMRTPAGEDMYAFVLMVAGLGQPSYKVWVGSAVPAAALSLLSVGTRLPARRLPDGDDTELVVDWEAALADRPGNQRRVASDEE